MALSWLSAAGGGGGSCAAAAAATAGPGARFTVLLRGQVIS